MSKMIVVNTAQNFILYLCCMCYIRSDSYAKHRAMLSASRVQDLLADRLIEGQRIYVSGVIGYTEFQNAEGHRRQSGHVLAKNLFLCDEHQDSDSGKTISSLNTLRFRIIEPKMIYVFRCERSEVIWSCSISARPLGKCNLLGCRHLVLLWVRVSVNNKQCL